MRRKWSVSRGRREKMSFIISSKSSGNWLQTAKAEKKSSLLEKENEWHWKTIRWIFFHSTDLGLLPRREKWVCKIVFNVVEETIFTLNLRWIHRQFRSSRGKIGPGDFFAPLNFEIVTREASFAEQLFLNCDRGAKRESKAERSNDRRRSLTHLSQFECRAKKGGEN